MSKAGKDDPVFKALADSRRREILDLLRDAPKTTGELCLHFQKSLDRCTVMQHLKVLENADLIIAHREGKFRWNYINPLPIQDIFDRWIHRYAAGHVQKLSRLKKELEGDGSPKKTPRRS